MNLAQPRTNRHYSREEFRRWCEAQPKGRYERVDGRIVAMAPERGAHLRVKGAIYKALNRGNRRRCALPGIARWCDGGDRRQ
jgi:Uma2 family endonuclease